MLSCRERRLVLYSRHFLMCVLWELHKRFQDHDIGRHFGTKFTGALGYADDLTILSPCLWELQKAICFGCEHIRDNLINYPKQTRGRSWGRLRVRIRSIEKCEVGCFVLLNKISRTACYFGIRTFLKQNNYYESATIWYIDHQYLAQYSEIINNLQEIPLIFCNYAMRSCGTWRKGPGQIVNPHAMSCRFQI